MNQLSQCINNVSPWSIVPVVWVSLGRLILTGMFLIASFVVPEYLERSPEDVAFRQEAYRTACHQFPWLTAELFDTVVDNAEYTGMDRQLILSVIHAESWGQQFAVSSSGAIGYMQVMPVHYPRAPADLFDMYRNIRMGTRILRDYYVLAKGDLVQTLKNYNSGPHSTYYNIPYIRKVLQQCRGVTLARR